MACVNLKKLLSVSLVFSLLSSILISQVYAQTIDITTHNSLQQEQWVNWYPANCVPHDEVVELAELLANEYPRKDLPRAVHDWICDNIFYDWAAFSEGTYSALQASDVIMDQKAVCEGISNLMQELLVALDIPCIKVWGVAIPESDSWDRTNLDLNRVNHTWNEFLMDGQWHVVDCTMDMNNRFEDGAFTRAEKGQTFFDPDSGIFSLTHKILYRGDDVFGDIPSEWAKAELALAVERAGLGLSNFRDYQALILKSEFHALFDRFSEDTAPITRAEAAALVFRDFIADKSAGESDDNYFFDLTDCDEEAIRAINSLYELGIMRGTGKGTFSPNSTLTRQEAIIMAARLIEREE